jgi:hypothetical protein
MTVATVGLVDIVQAYVDALNAAGIRATMDPRNVNPPCVLLNPPSVVLDIACGGTATFTAYALTRGPGNADAWRSLDALVTDAYGVLPLESFEPSSYAVDETSALPAYLLNWTEAITWP